MLTESEILQFINDDKTTDRKRFALLGQRYYEAEHDIKDYRLYYINADGNVKEDKTRSNIKISHPFFTELVDQKVQYMLSGSEQFIKSDNPELQIFLDEYFNCNEDFRAELDGILTGCSAKGFEYMYAYKNSEDKTAFQCADSIGVIEVREQDTDDGCAYVIYWYIDRIEKGQKKIKKIQVWDKDQTYFYVQEQEGKLLFDKTQPLNPRPHIIYTKAGDLSTYYEGFGFIPFFRLDNNRKQFSDLKPIKQLIDDYDLMSCGLSNNIQDGSEMYWVVSGFQGDDLDELINTIKTKKQVGIEEGGSVDIKTVDIPYQARQAKLELDEKNIYRFGMGFNSAQIGDGNVTNVVIKSRYALLDLKCNKLEIRLKQFLRKIIKVVLKEINNKNSTDYQMKDVYFNFEREVMTNASDNAQIKLTEAQEQQTRITTLLNLATQLDNETLMQNICDVLDIDYEDIKDKLPEDEETKTNEAQLALDALMSK